MVEMRVNIPVSEKTRRMLRMKKAEIESQTGENLEWDDFFAKFKHIKFKKKVNNMKKYDKIAEALETHAEIENARKSDEEAVKRVH